ncbi:uncharacterized protein LOC125957809 [Anopheles darlingi]|uniref:uncharacterized protein LOC125957809 n=1 Tax=Anopheles darlingi TaxID=43151 RepID=UPI00210048D2|nr:uncharacterized protein LOC125957809 [Anopheles darlingi]
MANPCSSKRPTGNKKGQQDSSKIKSNLSGLKHALHGTSYQLKLGIVVCLASARKLLVPNSNFTFKVIAEDPTAGKFDDIVYTFREGDYTGTLKIQAKHKLNKSALQDDGSKKSSEIQGKPKHESTGPKITSNDFIADAKNDFYIEQYYKSFRDQQPQTIETGLEGLIICTNAVVDDDAQVMWAPIDPKATSLDFYISTLFRQIRGTCYQLKTHYKRAILAKLMINAMKSKEEMVSWQNPLFKEYRGAILSIINKEDISTSVPSFKFTDRFLDSSFVNVSPSYEAFRKEFEDQYRQEFQIERSVWDDLKEKRVYVSEAFLSDEKNQYFSSASFPEDNVDESFNSFCERFRLVCDTFSEHGLDDAISELWGNLHSEGNTSQGKRCVETNLVTEKLFKTNFDWLMDPFAKPLHSDDFKNDLENIQSTLAHIKLKGTSDKLRKKVMGSSFRIRPAALQASELYEQIESETLLEIEAYDIQLGVTLISDILAMQRKDIHNALLLDDKEFVDKSTVAENVFSTSENLSCLIIICHEAFKTVQRIVRRWKKEILNTPTKQVLLVRKVFETSVDLNCFCIRDVTDESWKQFLDKSIPFCGTTILAAKLFQNNFAETSLEEFIQELDFGKQMNEQNPIIQTYQEIESTYVQRGWIDQKTKLQAENLYRSDRGKMIDILKDIREMQEEKISFVEITERIRKLLTFDCIFTEANKRGEAMELAGGDDVKKVLILLGEAGLGKSTSLTWLAWHLWNQNPAFWVIRCNLSDHCSDFKPFLQNIKNGSDIVIDENEALQLLYTLIYSSLLGQKNAQKCPECLVLSYGKVMLNVELMKHHNLSLHNLIHLLLFQEKFNAGELVLLLDGFDEIAPHYKDVVLKLLFHFDQFNGLRKMYLTSRPYGFKQLFKKAFKELAFFQLKPLSLQNKGSMLYRMMKRKLNYTKIDTEEIVDFHKALCVLILYYLDEMSNVPLNLMMSVEMFLELAERYINCPLKTVNKELFEAMKDRSKSSFIIEKFVEMKIQLIYCKFGAKQDAVDNPILIDKHKEEIEKIKRQHGLVALWVLLSKDEVESILSASEMCEASDCMEHIQEAREKTGIIHGIKDGTPIFIHRTFAEYLAAWWVIQRQMEGKHKREIKISSLQSFWEENGLRKHVDKILAKDHPLHLAVIEHDWETIKSLVSGNLTTFNEKDGGNRTLLHLLACYVEFKYWGNLLPNFVESNKSLSDMIRVKERLFGFTAFDCAVHINVHFLYNPTEHSEFICFLLHHGASINIGILYEQLVSSGQVKIRQAARYAKYAMEYLSRRAIEYESDDVGRNMKQFCHNVAQVLNNESSAHIAGPFNRQNISRHEHCYIEHSILEYIIEEDSVWMLDSIKQQMVDQEQFVHMVRNSLFELALEKKSIFVLSFFVQLDASLLSHDNLWRCILNTVDLNYTNEFKCFVDLYISQLTVNISNFKSCSNESNDDDDNVNYFPNAVVENDIYILDQYLHKALLNIPTEITVDIVNSNKIVLVLVLTIVKRRPSMLRYLKEAFRLNLTVGFIYYLAMISHKLFSKQKNNLERNVEQTYEYLLTQASSIGDIEGNKILRLALLTNLFKFSKCLIERYTIDFQAVDELNGWNVFHLCVSRPRCDDDNVLDTMLELFRCMFNKTEMNCFHVFDKKKRCILHLAIANGHKSIMEYIVARKLDINYLNAIESLGMDALPSLIFCCRAIYKISNCLLETECCREVLSKLLKQISKISFANPDESAENANRISLLLQENVVELYKIAADCGSLCLIYYLHRDFRSTIVSSFHGKNGLECIKKSLNSSDFRLFQWMVRQYCIDYHIKNRNENETEEQFIYDIFDKCDAERFDPRSVDTRQIYYYTELSYGVAELTNNKSKEDLCIIKLVVLAVSLTHEPAIRYLCDTFALNIDQKLMFFIMKNAHAASWKSNECMFCKADFDSMYKYLFERTSNLYEIDADGTNLLHLAVSNRLNCMAIFLIKQEIFNITTVNKQNGWNVFHYCVSRNSEQSLEVCCIENEYLFHYMLERVLKNDESTADVTVEELCFKANDGRQSVIQVAVEFGYVKTVEYLIRLRLGIDEIDEQKILNVNECERFKECYDLLQQMIEKFPFNAQSEKLLNKIAKPIDRFLLANIKHANKAKKVDTCRTAIKYRSVSTLEYLTTEYSRQTSQALASSSSRELFGCMMECIRRNRNSLFNVLVDHYSTLPDIQSSMKVQYETLARSFFRLLGGDAERDPSPIKSKFCYDSEIDEGLIEWSVLDQTDHRVSKYQGWIPLLILSLVHKRLVMTQYLVDKLKPIFNKSLVIAIMKMFNRIERFDHKILIYEFLESAYEKKTSLLHLYCAAGDEQMVRYLMSNFDPSRIESDEGWNAAHYCVSEPMSYDSWSNTLKLFVFLMHKKNVDCYGVYGRRGVSVLHLAVENGHKRIVEHIIRDQLGIEANGDIQDTWNLEKLNEFILEFERIISRAWNSRPYYDDILRKLNDRKMELTAFKQLFY